MIIGTRPSPSLFFHGCETKAGVGRTGNEASNNVQFKEFMTLTPLTNLQKCGIQWSNGNGRPRNTFFAAVYTGLSSCPRDVYIKVT